MAKGDYGKRNYFLRYFLVIKYLRQRHHATFADIRSFVGRETGLYDKEFIYEIRTFQRDLNDIRYIFNIDIRFNRNTKTYQIEESDNDNYNHRLLESLDVFHLLSSTQHLTGLIAVENKCKQGTEYLYGIMHAIKNHLKISMVYKKFYESKGELREIQPLALKEFKGRWYLIAANSSSNQLRTYALDRILAIDVQNNKFKPPAGFSVSEYFKHSYGIIRPEDEEPAEIILSFESYQGNYIKSYPLHPSQQILIDNDREFRIKIFVYITYDLIMEILSYGKMVKVIAPGRLKKEVARMR